MASYQKRGNKWRARVNKKGTQISKTFDSKSMAVAWAMQLESDINRIQNGGIPNRTFGELLERYANEVSVHKKGWRWEDIRIKAFLNDPIAKIKLPLLKKHDIAQWVNRRLSNNNKKNKKKNVKPSTVNREINLLSSCCSFAIQQWGWLKENPVSRIQRPKNPRHRDRLISDDEIKKITERAGYAPDIICKTKISRVGAVFLFAIETAMRSGEILNLKWEDVDFNERVATLHETKNGYKREVALTKKAIHIIRQMPKNREFIFNLSATTRDALFRKIKKACKINDLHFHDTRHEAVTRLAKKLSVYDLARMTGHRDVRMLMVYYNETASAIAKKLDQPFPSEQNANVGNYYFNTPTFSFDFLD